MYKIRLLAAFSGLFTFVFAFAFMIGTSLLSMIPFFSDLLAMSGEGFTIYYGLPFFKYVIGHIVQLFLFGTVEAIPNGIIIIFTALICVAIIIASFFKKRNEMMFYIAAIGGMTVGIVLLYSFFFGIKLYDGQIGYNYFQIMILNVQAPILPKVFFIVIFVAWILLFVFYFFLILFIFLAPARTEKYLKKQYEKEFATIKEVRAVSNEEFSNYIKEHAEEIKSILGINAQQTVQAQSVKPAETYDPMKDPEVIGQIAAVLSTGEVKDETISIEVGGAMHTINVAEFRKQHNIVVEEVHENKENLPKEEDNIIESK